jgi:hypothetical protein
MTVFVAHAPADAEAAESLEKFLERRGQFVELDDGQTALRPVQRGDVVVLCISKDLVFAPTRLRLEQRALDAWADGRLIVVKLDHGIAPVGLRDLPAIDASFEAQREFKWQEVANQVRETLVGSRATSAESEVMHSPQASPRRRANMIWVWGILLGAVLCSLLLPTRMLFGAASWLIVLPIALCAIVIVSIALFTLARWSLTSRSLLSALLLSLLALPGIGALAASGAIWLASRIGPTPGTFNDLRRGINEFGVRYGMPPGVTEWLFLFAIILTIVAFSLLVARLFKPRAKAAKREAAPQAEPERPAEPETPLGDVVFVSYASANAKDVLPVIEAAKSQGRQFWIDQKGIGAGKNWAGEIVRAIKSAPSVIVMCSKAAFESDHVKREIYLADRYRKKLTPVFIEQAEPPEDFEYFFAGVQQLKLFETPEAERPEALMRALGATS